MTCKPYCTSTDNKSNKHKQPPVSHNNNTVSRAHRSFSICIGKTYLKVGGDGQFYKERQSVYKSVFYHRQAEMVACIAWPQPNCSVKVHHVHTPTENVTLCLQGFDPASWLCCLPVICFKISWMDERIHNNTVMKTHKKSSDTTECQTSLNWKLAFDLGHSLFFSAGYMYVVSSAWGEVVLNPLLE